jgi:hypothetical protein
MGIKLVSDGRMIAEDMHVCKMIVVIVQLPGIYWFRGSLRLVGFVRLWEGIGGIGEGRDGGR